MSELGHKAGRYGSRTPTGREKQVVALVAEGLRNAEIAYRIGTTEQVVKNYLHVIFDKLGVWTRLELALWHEQRRDDEELRATIAHQPSRKGPGTTVSSNLVASPAEDGISVAHK